MKCCSSIRIGWFVFSSMSGSAALMILSIWGVDRFCDYQKFSHNLAVVHSRPMLPPASVVDGSYFHPTSPWALFRSSLSCSFLSQLHLPPYSKREVLSEKLAYAIENSQGVIDRD